MNSANPSEYFGGKWEKVSGGYLYATGSSVLAKTSYAGWNARSTVLTIDQIPSHQHNETIQTGDGNFNPVVQNRTGGSTSLAIWPENARGGWSNVGSGSIMKTIATGGGEGHTHDIATIDVWMWKRIS